MKHFGLMVNVVFFYSFSDNCYYFSVFDNKKVRVVWKKCPFDEIYMQKRMIYIHLIEPDDWWAFGIRETCLDMETSMYDIINEWEYEWKDYKELDEGDDRINLIKRILKEKINELKDKYPRL